MSDSPAVRSEEPGRRVSDSRERHRLEALADYLGIIALWSVVMFGGLDTTVNLAAVGGIISIAGVAGWMKHKAIPGGALVLIATWPLAKLLAALGVGGWRHFS